MPGDAESTMFEVECPQCEAVLEVTDYEDGDSFECADCGAEIVKMGDEWVLAEDLEEDDDDDDEDDIELTDDDEEDEDEDD